MTVQIIASNSMNECDDLKFITKDYCFSKPYVLDTKSKNIPEKIHSLDILGFFNAKFPHFGHKCFLGIYASVYRGLTEY